MSTDITAAVQRLNGQLPLQDRQNRLPVPLAGLHREVLRCLFEHGRAPSREEIGVILDGGDLDQALQRLGGDDLVVLNEAGTQVVGAYPMTEEDTAHRLTVNGSKVNAMCALDALSVGPMYGADVEIDSRCHVSGDPIHIHQENHGLLEVRPTTDVRVGVRWQNPTACAAHSMCMEMVFLRDEQTALGWQGDDTENISLFTLEEAVEFGARFFRPLVNPN